MYVFLLRGHLCHGFHGRVARLHEEFSVTPHFDGIKPLSYSLALSATVSICTGVLHQKIGHSGKQTRKSSKKEIYKKKKTYKQAWIIKYEKIVEFNSPSSHLTGFTGNAGCAVSRKDANAFPLKPFVIQLPLCADKLSTSCYQRKIFTERTKYSSLQQEQEAGMDRELILLAYLYS